MLHGSRSFFNAELDDTLRQRYAKHDIHCALPLWGAGDHRTGGSAAQIEQDAMVGQDHMTDVLREHGLRLAYRANRAIATGLESKFSADTAELRLSVNLDAGVYLTTLLSHVVDFATD